MRSIFEEEEEEEEILAQCPGVGSMQACNSRYRVKCMYGPIKLIKVQG
jgi:hypothetical protein